LALPEDFIVSFKGAGRGGGPSFGTFGIWSGTFTFFLAVKRGARSTSWNASCFVGLTEIKCLQLFSVSLLAGISKHSSTQFGNLLEKTSTTPDVISHVRCLSSPTRTIP
jgi:hypothetical protein